MFLYEKFNKELNEMAFYVLQCFKREYETYLSTVKVIKLNEMLKSKKLVVLDGEIGGNLIHINPCNEIFQKETYKTIKDFYLKNQIIPEIFKMFITTNISRSEYATLSRPNLQQEFSIYLRNGFISYIVQEFCPKYRLDLPECRNKDNLDFVNYMESILPKGRPFKELIFYYDYIDCIQQVYCYLGIDLVDVYITHIKKRKEIEETIKNILVQTSLTEDEVKELENLFKTKSISEYLDIISKKIKVLYKNNKNLQKQFIKDINLCNDDLIRRE